ncbi:MAG: hypothetical protein MZV70_49465 [Desulfobacterales bacterium]|nr:hypothetical protein [Desulfobacterales bacterium]
MVGPGPAWRFITIVLMIVGAWIGIRPLVVPPVPARTNAAIQGFDAERAWRDVGIISTSPRVPGSPGMARAREHLYGEFEKLGLRPEITDVLVVRQDARLGAAQAARAQNLVARWKERPARALSWSPGTWTRRPPRLAPAIAVAAPWACSRRRGH